MRGHFYAIQVMQQIRANVATEFEQVNRLIVEQLHSDVPMVENVGTTSSMPAANACAPARTAVRHGTGRLQPRAHQFAAIIEFIHTATLLHDDVVISPACAGAAQPPTPSSATRPPCWWATFSIRAFQLMVQLADMDILSHMADTTNTIAEGEVLQLARAGRPGPPRRNTSM